MKAYNLRNPPRGLVVHTERGSQYTGKVFQNLLNSYGLRSSMGDVGACRDNAVMERFWGSLKHEWLHLVAQPPYAHMMQDVADYIRYYNLERNHSLTGELSPVQFEQMTEKSVRLARPEHTLQGTQQHRRKCSADSQSGSKKLPVLRL